MANAEDDAAGGGNEQASTLDAPTTTSVCDYCDQPANEGEGELVPCITYSDLSTSKMTKDFFMSAGCDKFLHMSSVRSFQEDAYNGSVAIERAGYAVIGFCETCFRAMEAARAEEHDTEED